MVRRLLLIIAVLVLLYVGAYGLVRWRKFLVIRETHLKEEQLLARFVERGWDVRDDWRGHLKNRINPFLVTLFQPLIQLENACRGFKRPLHPQQLHSREHGTEPSNQAMERTADRFAFTFEMTSTLPLRVTRGLVRRRSSCSR